MRKLVVMLSVSGVMLISFGADVRRNQNPPPRPAEKEAIILPASRCYGYTIIEFGKGINCKGDTVLLEKSKGFQQRVR